MPSALRKVLIESHVAAIAVAVLIFFSVAQIINAVWMPALYAVYFLLTAIAIRIIPYLPNSPDVITRQTWLNSFINLFSALASLAAAWALSRQVYGTGPLRMLGSYREKLSRKTDA